MTQDERPMTDAEWASSCAEWDAARKAALARGCVLRAIGVEIPVIMSCDMLRPETSPYRGVLVYWDSDVDTRVLDVVDAMPPEVRDCLISIGESKGGAEMRWRREPPGGCPDHIDHQDENSGDYWTTENTVENPRRSPPVPGEPYPTPDERAEIERLFVEIAAHPDKIEKSDYGFYDGVWKFFTEHRKISRKQLWCVRRLHTRVCR